MPRIPFKLLLFVLAGSFLWIHLAPKRAAQAMGVFRGKRDAGPEEEARVLVQEKVRGEICSIHDLCEYRPSKWEGFHRPDASTLQLEHHFFCDGALRRYLFRIRNGNVAEVIDLR